MARHNEIVTAFKEVIGCYDNDNADHRMLMMMIFLKVSDISNEARPMDVSEPWVECLLQEFFMQVSFRFRLRCIFRSFQFNFLNLGCKFDFDSLTFYLRVGGMTSAQTFKIVLINS